MIFGFSDVSTNPYQLTWWFSINAILLLRMCDLAHWNIKSSKSPSSGLLGIQRYATGCIATATAWSLYVVIYFSPANNVDLLFPILIICSLAGSSASFLAASRFIAISYSMILLVPISVMGLVSEIPHRQALGILGLTFALGMVFTCIRATRFTSGAIYQKNLNEMLVREMEDEKNLVAQTNQELEVTSSELSLVNINLEDEVKRRTEEIYRLSNVDPLTQLVNRKAFTSSLEALIELSIVNDSPLALLFIDLNGFKKINDTMGHIVGDSVLVQVTQRISAFSENNSAGRWNGDEFLVALPYSDQDSAMSIAKAIATSIAQPIYVHGNELHLSASIGIAMAPAHSLSATELIQLADLTMCEQKRSGKKRPRLFSNDLKEKITASQMILEGLQHAIERKQFYLCYQPILTAKDNVSFAFEALLRWNFNGKLIGPDVFIPLAEKSGLIKEIGAWVLNRACMDANHWQFNQQAAVSVNVSVIQLMDDGFIRLLDNCLRSSGLAPERLHLEVTESTFVENKVKVRQQLEQIQARNIDISIDDFGTGYSSLSQLQSLPVNYVKIDKSFVDNIEGKGEAIIRATLFIARELHYKTIAEGVETKDQAAALSAMGVDYLQGYYFAKPMKNEDLIVWQNPITSIFS
ncbi:putative bifunctional diguanylate cyclase/phosphodiesterase [Paraglaciecola arctica]|uniref:Diguanylate cyclase/phosphodiesterase n=1 Tax=Paraglaciecola arctica BSs20135 TaxID=493475 RepID=K6YQ23_9ALTE|nr:bifunctional diguanylate cyclase/phosphodiesterase [Paraglaciecola arctica]GAC20272.1 diguanylate cyclase/phosphodiesterase [Paraglaciecola arctica BSs20135]